MKRGIFFGRYRERIFEILTPVTEKLHSRKDPVRILDGFHVFKKKPVFQVSPNFKPAGASFFGFALISKIVAFLHQVIDLF